MSLKTGFSKSGKWYSHVITIDLVLEIHLEIIFSNSNVVFASSWKSADTINSAVTGDVTAGDKSRKCNKLLVDAGGEAKTLEVSIEGNWVVSTKFVEELACINSIGLVDNTVTKTRKAIGVVGKSGHVDSRVTLVGVVIS